MDDADKINYTGEIRVIRYIYDIIKNADGKRTGIYQNKEKLLQAKSTFKVSLGIMPDYTYNGAGVHVDSVSAGKAAEKVSVKTGDVLTQLGEHKFTDVQSYMNALNKFNKGDSTKLKVDAWRKKK